MHPLLTLADLKAALPTGQSLPPVNSDIAKWNPHRDVELSDADMLTRYRQMFAYDPATGDVWSRFLYFVDYSTQKLQTQKVRRKGGGGWNRVNVDGRNYAGGTMVWFLHHGRWPINGLLGRNDADATNDRIENLFEVHSRKYDHVRRYGDQWEAFHVFGGRHRRIGLYDHEDAAGAAFARFKAGELTPVKRGAGRGVARLYDRWQAYALLPGGKRKFLGVHDTEAGALAARARWDALQEVADLV